MTDQYDMPNLTRRLLALWQEQMSLMAQDAEITGYGDSLFKAMGMPVPQAFNASHSKDPNSKKTDSKQEAPYDPKDSPTAPSASEVNIPEGGTKDGAKAAALSPEQRLAMADELSRRIDELARQIAEHEAAALSPKPKGKS